MKSAATRLLWTLNTQRGVLSSSSSGSIAVANTVSRQTCLAGSPSPRRQRARRYASTQPARSGRPSYEDVFTLSEIPLSSIQGVISRNGDAFNQLTPEEYYATAMRFTEAIKKGSSPWTVSLTGKDAIPADVLHNVACIMRQIQGPRSADAFATAMWSSASEMGYRPSTLSLARQLIRSGAYGRIPQLRKAEAQFKQLVSAGKDADALTAEGELLYEQGKYELASAALKRAMRAQTTFEWKAHCELCLGKSYMKLGKVDAARSIFETLSESGFVEADIELSQILRKSEQDAAEQHMYTAACNGRRDMFTRLSELELESAGSGSRTGRTADDSRRWAMEWSKLADPRVEY